MSVVAFLRFLIIGPMMVVWTGVLSVVSIIGVRFLPNPDFPTGMLRFWSRGLLKMAGVKVIVHGAETLPHEGVIFVFNHSSHMDIPVLNAAVPAHMRFGAKIELFKVPFFGRAMRDFGVLPIVRSQREEVLRIYRDAIARAKAGMSFILAPEGTRQSGQALGPFKSGPFVFASEGGLKVVPVVLVGVHRVMPKHSLLVNVRAWTTPVLVKILPTVDPDALSSRDWETLRDHVRDQMVRAYAQGLAELSRENAT